MIHYKVMIHIAFIAINWNCTLCVLNGRCGGGKRKSCHTPSGNWRKSIEGAIFKGGMIKYSEAYPNGKSLPPWPERSRGESSYWKPMKTIGVGEGCFYTVI